jgi:hypothetical protein
MTGLIVAGIAIGSDNKASMPSHMHDMAAMQSVSSSDLRALLGRQLGQHAVLAMNATNAGVTGSKAFPAAAKALDQNSVALSKSIASVYGAKAGNTFLNGKFMWRAHIKFFVDYTVATAKGNKAGQAKAVANLKTYTVKFGDFLATATNLPKPAVRADLLAHVLQLKGQLDAYAGKNNAKAARGRDREAVPRQVPGIGKPRREPGEAGLPFSPFTFRLSCRRRTEPARHPR